MNNNIFRWRQIRTPGALSIRERKILQLLAGVEFAILVNLYDVVTPFDWEVQEVPTMIPPDPSFWPSGNNSQDLTTYPPSYIFYVCV